MRWAIYNVNSTDVFLAVGEVSKIKEPKDWGPLPHCVFPWQNSQKILWYLFL